MHTFCCIASRARISTSLNRAMRHFRHDVFGSETHVNETHASEIRERILTILSARATTLALELVWICNCSPKDIEIEMEICNDRMK